MRIVYVAFLFVFSCFMLPNDEAYAQDFNAIRGVYISEENADSDPELDSAGVNVLFRDSTGKIIDPSKGTVFQYKCVVYDYKNEQEGNKIGEKSGEVVSDGHNTFFIVNLNDIESKKRILAHVQIITPNGKTIEGKGTKNFNPHNY